VFHVKQAKPFILLVRQEHLISVLVGFQQAVAMLGKQPRLGSEANAARRYHMLL
jgi:hypothetical protein